MRSERLSALSFKGLSTIPSMHLRHVQSTIYLFPFEEIPSYLQHNPYITAGYRCYLSARQCLRSVFVLSNELVNIWTHLLMILCWMFILLYDQMITLPYAGANIQDHFIYLTFVLCVQTCMMFSVCFHTFNGHTLENVYLRWYAADLIGILVGILGCYIIGLHYAFTCFRYLQFMYISSIGGFMIFSIFFMIHPKYLTYDWCTRRKIHLIMLVIYGLVPAIHWVFVSQTVEVNIFLPKVITLYLLLALAFSFYASKFPECCLPGKFNLIGQSHNVWHVLTAFSFLYWRDAAIKLMIYRMEHSCAGS